MSKLTVLLERRGSIIDWATRLVGIAGLTAAIALYAGQRDYVQCQAEVNETLIASTRALTEAGDGERLAQRSAEDATRRLFTDPVLSKPAAARTPAEREHLAGLFAAYQTALTRLDVERVEADKARAEHPVPPPPSQTCG